MNVSEIIDHRFSTYGIQLFVDDSAIPTESVLQMTHSTTIDRVGLPSLRTTNPTARTSKTTCLAVVQKPDVWRMIS